MIKDWLNLIILGIVAILTTILTSIFVYPIVGGWIMFLILIFEMFLFGMLFTFIAIQTFADIESRK
jgi:hypothetical protein